MEDVMLGAGVQRGIEVLGIFAFALSGAHKAIRLDFDVVGILMLGWITAFGGGVIRDVLLGVTPPAALTDLVYFVMPIVAALVSFLAYPFIRRLMKPVLMFDALGLALFTVVGTLTATQHGLEPIPAASLGVITGVGGGLLRDVIARDIPAVVRADAELYAIPAIAGALLVALTAKTHVATFMGIVAASLIVVIRILALVFRWHAPRALGSKALHRD